MITQQNYLVTEDEWQQTLIDIAHTYGWRVAHFRKAMTLAGNWITPVQAEGKGFPDLVLAKTGHALVLIEVKSQKGRLSPAQQEWQKVLETIPEILYLVVRPSDYEEVKEVLSQK
tara:strand:- start:198 stop:542 length:345 start_codon:yes stop_codon:yes gene_type:complete